MKQNHSKFIIAKYDKEKPLTLTTYNLNFQQTIKNRTL